MIMSPELRRIALVSHLAVSVGWLGAVGAYMTLDIAAATSKDPETLRAAYVGMDLIARRVIVPAAFATVATGLIMSLGTKWGLFRHYWVLISFAMTAIATIVLLIETRTISHFAAMARSSTTSVQTLQSLGGTLLHSVGGAVVLLVVMILNIYKPRGMTAYGFRKQVRAEA